MEAQILRKLNIVECPGHALISCGIRHEVHCGGTTIVPTKFGKSADFFLRQVYVLGQERLIELGNLYCAFLKYVASHERPVDVFPLIAQFDDEILVEGDGALVVHPIHAE